jgi:hypothetical protein
MSRKPDVIIKTCVAMRSQTFSATDEELKSFVCKQQNTIE